MSNGTGLYHGTIAQLRVGAFIGPSSSQPRSIDTALDAGRSAGQALRSVSVSAAASIKDATAIAAIEAYSASHPVPHSLIRVYRVELTSFHSAPVAILAELQSRLASGAPTQSLVQEYWFPTKTWQLMEVLAPSFVVKEEVTPATEAGVYIRRWVDYTKDLELARLL